MLGSSQIISRCNFSSIYFQNELKTGSIPAKDAVGAEAVRRDEEHGGRGGQVGRRRPQEIQRCRRNEDHGAAGVSLTGGYPIK